MLKKINKIQNLGLFCNFRWCINTKDFEKDNLIYGWNYSGKTTLSRLFRILEKKENYTGIKNLGFELTMDDNSAISEKDIPSHNLNIRVFNKEYVDDTFGRFDDPRVGAVYIALGEDKINKENIDKKEKDLKMKNDEFEKHYSELVKIDKEKKDIENKIENDKTNQAKIVKELLQLPDFNKNKINSRLDNKGTVLLGETELEQQIKKYQQDNKSRVQEIPTSNLGIDSEKISNIKGVLQSEINISEDIPVLQGDDAKKEWVHHGLKLHNPTDQCLFCDNKITKERIEKLNRFFSEEYRKTLSEVEKLIGEVNTIKGNVNNISFPSKNDFLTSSQNDFDEPSIEKIRTEYLQKLDYMLNLLEMKKKSVDKPISIDGIESEYIPDVSQLNTLIEKNNESVQKFDKEKKEAEEKIINHYVQELRPRIEEKVKLISEKDEKIKEKRREKEKSEDKIREIEKEIGDLKKSTSNIDAGLGELNETIQGFLGHEELKLEKVSDPQQGLSDGEQFLFLLKRGDMLAKNLSEGEKTVIAFSYFYLTLKSSNSSDAVGNKLRETIVFIDDPISSLDEQHLSHMSAFIKENLIDKCKQLFITTHNFTLFHSLRTFKHIQSGRIDRKFFIQNMQEGGQRVAKITNLPKLIEDFKTEYNFCFENAFEFINTPNPNDYDKFPMIPNTFRIFIETYCGIHYPSGGSWKDALPELIDDEILRKNLYHTLDRGSHSDGADSTKPNIQNPEILKEIIEKTLACIKSATPEHFKCLEGSVPE